MAQSRIRNFLTLFYDHRTYLDFFTWTSICLPALGRGIVRWALSHHGPALSVAPDSALALPTAPEPLSEAFDLGEGWGVSYIVLLTPGSGDKDNMLYHFQALANSLRNWHPRTQGWLKTKSLQEYSRHKIDYKGTLCTEWLKSWGREPVLALPQ